MPELPEVQTIINTLNNSEIINKKIIDIKILIPKIIKENVNNFVTKVKDKTIINFSRKGKYILINLNEGIILVHLRMEGKLFYCSEEETKTIKHTCVLFILNNKKVLIYADTRMFGTINYINDINVPSLDKLGIDPFSDAFNVENIKNIFKNSLKPIKTSLLDQTKICGIGNIYADEILFASKIHPLSKTKNVNIQNLNLIIENTKLILSTAIKYGGTTVFSFKSSLNHGGNFQKHLKVYNREKQKCINCNSFIKRIKINGRSSYFCPKCQKIF